MENTKEFRIVVADVLALKPDPSRAADFEDHYLSRETRIRHFTKHPAKAGKWYTIATEPGMIVKDYKETDEKSAKNLLKDAILIIKKKGIGHFNAETVDGYAERVMAYRPGEDNPFLDEVQIEFECGMDKLKMVREKLRPVKVIEQGLFDYVSLMVIEKNKKRKDF
jgi:hypothetical protein